MKLEGLFAIQKSSPLVQIPSQLTSV